MAHQVYMAGAITHAVNAVAWRARASVMLEDLKFVPLNPLQWEAKTMTDAAVVTLDNKLILSSVAVLANVREASWGTAMEIHFAKQQGIPVFAFGTDRASVSPWLRHHTFDIRMLLPNAIQSLSEWATEHGYL